MSEHSSTLISTNFSVLSPWLAKSGKRFSVGRVLKPFEPDAGRINPGCFLSLDELARFSELAGCGSQIENRAGRNGPAEVMIITREKSIWMWVYGVEATRR